MELSRELPLTPPTRWLDWSGIVFALLVLAGAGLVWARFPMDNYDLGILLLVTPLLMAFGLYWRAMRWVLPLVGALSMLSISLYQGQVARAENVFLLKYFLASQSGIMWMCTLFMFALVIGLASLPLRSAFAASFARGLTWAAVVMGLTGLLVRWHVSYLLLPGNGHIPVSNLYEVFVLFCLIAALVALFYCERYRSPQLLPLALLVVNAAVAFIFWYIFSRGAHDIQPLIPALQSYWMKIHVPANFIGYGAFSLAAMCGLAILLKEPTQTNAWLPDAEVLDEIMYKANAIGFFFFTIATILGALWAAEAWGGYWSWDPKETWALIVWLNYAAWLHMRLVKGLRGPILAWWSLVGLLVVTFAFVGVNTYLSGLHSYGKL
ncbi:c-type cytochrome biogenesis protein CcsB [Leeia sp.]|uniref:c-type cytochrome biogenesis protein CcsB n=1 Tax=Leeia sp. TaxID=2884678 RepID=UPI0035AFCA45